MMKSELILSSIACLAFVLSACDAVVSVWVYRTGTVASDDTGMIIEISAAVGITIVVWLYCRQAHRQPPGPKFEDVPTLQPAYIFSSIYECIMLLAEFTAYGTDPINYVSLNVVHRTVRFVSLTALFILCNRVVLSGWQTTTTVRRYVSLYAACNYWCFLMQRCTLSDHQLLYPLSIKNGGWTAYALFLGGGGTMIMFNTVFEMGIHAEHHSHHDDDGHASDSVGEHGHHDKELRDHAAAYGFESEESDHHHRLPSHVSDNIGSRGLVVMLCIMFFLYGALLLSWESVLHDIGHEADQHSGEHHGSSDHGGDHHDHSVRFRTQSVGEVRESHLSEDNLRWFRTMLYAIFNTGLAGLCLTSCVVAALLIRRYRVMLRNELELVALSPKPFFQAVVNKRQKLASGIMYAVHLIQYLTPYGFTCATLVIEWYIRWAYDGPIADPDIERTGWLRNVVRVSLFMKTTVVFLYCTSMFLVFSTNYAQSLHTWAPHFTHTT